MAADVRRYMERIRGERCTRCDGKRWPLLVIDVWRPPMYRRRYDPDERGRVARHAVCQDRAGCDARIVRAREVQAAADERARVRRAPIVLAEPPSPGGPQGSASGAALRCSGRPRGARRPRTVGTATRTARAGRATSSGATAWCGRRAMR